MKAMILAAGYGKRMQAHTDVPKPLIKVHNTTLIERNILALKNAGIKEIVINVSYKADQIISHLDDGAQHGVSIEYSIEKTPLETGGGVKKALPLLSDHFIVLSADIWTDYPFNTLLSKREAHVVLVKHKEKGDFGLEEQQVIVGDRQLTYANIAVLSKALFSSYQDDYFPLSHVLYDAVHRGVVTGEYYEGCWYNVGSPQVLTQLNARTSTGNSL